jgi:hypothetical protein
MSSGPDEDLIKTDRLDAVLAKFEPADQALIKATVKAEMSALEAENERFKVEARIRAAEIGGRPNKTTRKGQRSRITIDLSSPTRALIEKQAKISGRRVSREAEILIEECLLYRRMAEDTRSTVEQMFNGMIESAFVRLGYRPVLVKEGKLWAEPGFPGLDDWLPAATSSQKDKSE